MGSGRKGRNPVVTVLCLLAIGAGIALSGYFARHAWLDWRIRHRWRRVTCTIVAATTWATSSDDGRGHAVLREHPRFTFRYDALGRTRTCSGYDSQDGATSGREVLDRFAVGGSYPCWYDPDRPDVAVLCRDPSPRFYLGMSLPLALISIPLLVLRASW